MEVVSKFLNKSLGIYNVRGIYIEPTYWMAAAVAFLFFLLIFTVARVRYLYVHWNLGRPSISMLFWGFILAMIFEGFLILGGRTLFTEVLGWKDAPKPISTLLSIARRKIVDVMGISDEVPISSTNVSLSSESVIKDYESLSSSDREKVKNFICKP